VSRNASDVERLKLAAAHLLEAMQQLRKCEDSDFVLPLISDTRKILERYQIARASLLPRRPGEESRR
jgi:hypothetical protein